MPSVETEFTDYTHGIRIGVRIWRDHEGRAIIALDPRNDISRDSLINGRRFLKGYFDQKYELADSVMYESQDNGTYTPVREDFKLNHGASISNVRMQEAGEALEVQAWKHSQKLDSHRLPPPTPYTEWPRPEPGPDINR
jgi:hypothetical protein